MNYTLTPIGTIVANETGFGLQLSPEYRKAMTGLEGFSHLQILWWFSECDTPEARTHLLEEKPYKNGPDLLGTFATRSPLRPNPIAVTVAAVTHIDPETGFIGLAWIDAFDGTPVLDIKPYSPCTDRVETPSVPEWCRTWPSSVEGCGEFDWSSVFNF